MPSTGVTKARIDTLENIDGSDSCGADNFGGSLPFRKLFDNR
jgi:hypothetical protein